MVAVKIKGKTFKTWEELGRQFSSRTFWKAPTLLRRNRMVSLGTMEYVWGYMVFNGLKELKPFENAEWVYLVSNPPPECEIVITEVPTQTA